MTTKTQADRLARMASIADSRARAQEILFTSAARAAQAATERHQRILRLIDSSPCVGNVGVLAAAASLRVVLQSAADIADSRARSEDQRREAAKQGLLSARHKAEHLATRATKARTTARAEAEIKASLDHGPTHRRKQP